MFLVWIQKSGNWTDLTYATKIFLRENAENAKSNSYHYHQSKNIFLTPPCLVIAGSFDWYNVQCNHRFQFFIFLCNFTNTHFYVVALFLLIYSNSVSAFLSFHKMCNDFLLWWTFSPPLNVNKLTGSTFSNVKFENHLNCFYITNRIQVNDTLTDALIWSLRAKMTFKSSLIHVSQKSVCFEYTVARCTWLWEEFQQRIRSVPFMTDLKIALRQNHCKPAAEVL